MAPKIPEELQTMIQYRMIERLAEVVDGVSDVIVELTSRGELVYANAAWTRLLGHAQSDVVGTSLTSYVREDQRSTVDEAIARVDEGEQHIETEMLRADGQLVTVQISLRPGQTGDIFAAITDLRPLREQQDDQLAALLLPSTTLLSRELDRDRLLQLITDEATRLSGAEFGAFFFNAQGESGEHYLLYTLSGAPREAFEKMRMPRATPLFGPTFRGEGIIRLDDVREDPRYGKWGPQPEGHPKVVSYLAVPVVSPDGGVEGGIFLAHGKPGRFTEVHEKLVAGLARQAGIGLENARLYRALQESEQRAREADRKKDEFLALLGHELRNPLSPILTALELMRLRGDESMMREREVIERQVRHMVTLVDDLLDISRITRGKVELQRERIELSSVIKHALEVASPEIEHRAHHLSVEMPDASVVVDVDEERFTQVLVNLLTNAAKYTEPGGRIELGYECLDGEVLIRVRDNGIGIDPQLLPHVFDTFSQGPQTADRSHGGLGLGLAIVKNLVELHGGRVSAHSEGRNRGAEFTVRIARAPTSDAIEEAEPHDLRAPRRGAAARVLVVDDNHDVANMLSAALAEIGYDVCTRYEGPTALEAIEEYRPSVALIDIGLPVMTGYEVAQQIRASEDLADVRLVAVTGYGQARDREQALEAGFDAHLVKPIDIALLDRTIRELLKS